VASLIWMRPGAPFDSIRDAVFTCARPVHLIITMIRWIRTSRLSIKISLSSARCAVRLHSRRGVHLPSVARIRRQLAG